MPSLFKNLRNSGFMVNSDPGEARLLPLGKMILIQTTPLKSEDVAGLSLWLEREIALSSVPSDVSAPFN